MKRRKFVKNTGLTVGALGVAGYAGSKILTSKISPVEDSSQLIEGSNKWKNWSGNQQCKPLELFLPKTEEALAHKLRTATEKLRVVGGGHSFSPVVPTDQILTSISNLSGVISYDKGSNIVTLGAGSLLYNLTDELHELGLAFPNQGDIDKQSLGGAVSTSTHGTGSNYTSFAGTVKGFRLVTADGQVLNCSKDENPELYFGGVVSLGTLGIVSQYDMELVPSFKLKEKVYPEKLETVMDNFSAYVESNRHFEFFPFLYSDTVLVKELNDTEEDITPVQDPILNEDVLLSAGLTLSGKTAKRAKFVQKLMSGVFSEETRVNYSHKIYPTVRNVRFNEMEYELPFENWRSCLEEVLAFGQKQKFPIFFPLEVRTVKRDNFWMSPFYDRDTVSISIHQYNEYEYEEIFRSFEKIFLKYGGRPHWGKLCYISKDKIQELYPKFEDFAHLKNELDPSSRFSNPYMKKIFGA